MRTSCCLDAERDLAKLACVKIKFLYVRGTLDTKEANSPLLQQQLLICSLTSLSKLI